MCYHVIFSINLQNKDVSQLLELSLDSLRVIGNRKHSYTSHERKLILRYHPLSKAYKSCCCMGILILSLCPNVVLMYGLYGRLWIILSILTMRSLKIGSSPIFKISAISDISYDKAQGL